MQAGCGECEETSENNVKASMEYMAVQVGDFFTAINSEGSRRCIARRHISRDFLDFTPPGNDGCLNLIWSAVNQLCNSYDGNIDSTVVGPLIFDLTVTICAPMRFDQVLLRADGDGPSSV
jgi:hypothetical protein